MRPRAVGLSAGHVPVAPQPCALRGPSRSVPTRFLVQDPGEGFL